MGVIHGGGSLLGAFPYDSSLSPHLSPPQCPNDIYEVKHPWTACSETVSCSKPFLPQAHCPRWLQ